MCIRDRRMPYQQRSGHGTVRRSGCSGKIHLVQAETLQDTGSHRSVSYTHLQYNPFLILAGRETTENHGPCYSMSFVYSGAFKAEAETDQYGQTRMSMGLQDEMFSYELKPGDVYKRQVLRIALIPNII